MSQMSEDITADKRNKHTIVEKAHAQRQQPLKYNHV